MENETKYSGASIGQAVLAITGIGSWLGGIALAGGWFETTVTILFFPYSWYLFVGKIMLMVGML